MSDKYPVVSWRELTALLKRYGYVLVSQRGSHMKYRLGQRSVVVIPKHKTISIEVFKNVLKEISRALNKDEKEFNRRTQVFMIDFSPSWRL